MPTLLALALAAYLIGSVSFAVVVSRLFGLPDPRTYGSGNPGTANMLRSGNKAAALLTLLGDALKGWVAVWLALLFAPSHLMEAAMAVAGVGAVVGHMVPAFHRFKGGKGVATALGVLLAFSLWLGLAAVATWVVVAALFRMSSLASMLAALFAMVATCATFGFLHPYTVGVAVMTALLLWRHRQNIRSILAGTERKLGEKVIAP